MIAYLNENSLGDYVDWSSALKLFLAAAQELRTAQVACYRDSAFFSSVDFSRHFNAIGFPKDQSALVRQLVFGDGFSKCWRPGRLSNDSDRYICPDPNLQLRDHSICEAAEQKMLQNSLVVGLISAVDSTFGHRCVVQISKDRSHANAILFNGTSPERVKKWIAEQRGSYQTSSAVAPKDFQTILELAPERFKFTGKIARHGSRRIFEEVRTGRLYYVDDAHVGNGAHLEVFSANREHLGTANVHTGELDTTKRKNGRTLKL